MIVSANRVCTYCVMDASNPAIEFDHLGQCNCCRDALRRKPHEWWPDDKGAAKMQRLAEILRREGQGKPYDVMVGLSGGIDSAYLAHVASRRYGLRLLAVHVDGGWNSEPAVRNIESIVRGLNVDLHTYVVEWQEMRDLQVAFLKASVLNQDMPQDHAFFATLYRTAARFGLRHFLSGVNFASESVMAPKFGFPSIDGLHVRAVHERFGKENLTTFPTISLTQFLWMTRVRKQLTVHRPLNFIAYDKEAAKFELQREYKWRDYGSKHSESRFTKFYQEIYLPRKFGFDKRRLHLSSLIVSGQISRESALAELATPISSPAQVRRDLRFVSKKLGLRSEELEEFIEAPPISHFAYPNQMSLHSRLSALKSAMRRFARPSMSKA